MSLSKMLGSFLMSIEGPIHVTGATKNSIQSNQELLYLF